MRQAGLSTLGTLLTVLILGAGIFVGSQVFPIYYSYWELQGHFEEMASKGAVHPDKHIRDFLEKEIKNANISADPKDLIIKRQGRTILIELEYTEYLTLKLGEDREYDLWEFNFNPRAEDDLQ